MSCPPEVPLRTAYQLPKREEVSAIEGEGVRLEVIDSRQPAAEQQISEPKILCSNKHCKTNYRLKR